MKRLYVDTSAYLCLLLGETNASALRREFRGAKLLSSVLLVLEANRNLVRLAREGVLTAESLRGCLDRIERDREAFLLRDLTLDLCEVGPMPIVTTPRSPDLVHIRTAAWFHDREPIDRFVTLDAPQEQAARELHLPV